jgi:hypothetical protein
MNTLKNTLSYLTLVGLTFIIGCGDNEPIQEAETYSWVTSSKSPEGTFTIYDFKIGSDGLLYAMGWDGNQRIFSKFINNNWQTIAQVDETVIIDFSVYKDVVYYSNYATLKKVNGGSPETILNAEFCGLEVFQNLLIITGTTIHLDGNEYTIMSYDGENTFTPIDSDIQSSMMKIVNDKLFIAGHPLKIFDGINLMATGYYGGFFDIDESESIYSWGSIDDSNLLIRKFVSGNHLNVGNSIKSNAIVNRISVSTETIVFSGVIDITTSETFFLNSKNLWTKIPTTDHINDLIYFDGKILAATNDGQVLEMVLD